MILHNDKDAFRVLLERISTETGHREDVLEKDYYVTLILKELSTQTGPDSNSPVTQSMVK